MISNLNEKLSGQEPITREELFLLVNSWGRNDGFRTDDNLIIRECLPKECYDLSNLDVSKIEDLSFIFRDSKYNGDLSKWDVSNCKTMYKIFSFSEFNHNSLNSWNISNIANMQFVFFESKFDKDISSWQFNENVNCHNIFYANFNFQNKYNNCRDIQFKTKDFIKWFENNKNKMKEINTSKEEIFDFFGFEEKIKNDLI